MGLVKYALKFRASFYILALLITLLGAAAVVRMPKDVFPSVDIPVVSIIWSYQGLSSDEMEKRVTTFTEFAISNNVTGIKNIGSQTLQGVAVEKVYFQPDVNIDLAIAQTVSAMNSIRSQLPNGINPPIIVRFSASSVPVIQMALSGEKQTEQELYDYGQYRLRQTLITAPGSTIPSPYGGRHRQIMVDIDQAALQARGLTPQDVTNAVFSLAQDTVLRVQTYVPQGVTPGIRAGIVANVTIPEFPGRTFPGKVARDASALNENTRTLLVEVDVPNADEALRAGLYAMVAFGIPRSSPSVIVPAEALIFDSDGLRVATVVDGDRVRMRKVSIARDFGTRVELRDGLDGGERVALSPPADLGDGQPVSVRTSDDTLASRT